MTINQQTPWQPVRRKRTSYEKLRHQVQCLNFAWARISIKEVYGELGPAPWFQSQLFRQLDARILAHGGRKGAGITRPRKRRAGDPPYEDRTDAAGRRWLCGRGSWE